jgi:hypothetical protein
MRQSWGGHRWYQKGCETLKYYFSPWSIDLLENALVAQLDKKCLPIIEPEGSSPVHNSPSLDHILSQTNPATKIGHNIKHRATSEFSSTKAV